MFGNKNTSPSALAAYTAVILAIIFAAGSVILRDSWISLVVTFVVVFIFSYLIIHSVLQQFINRKIKLIYKFIFQTKANKQEDFYQREILPPKSMEEVEQDVQQWAIEKRNELENMKKNEEFRKEFLLNLSHELKTPAFAIQGYVQALLEGAASDDEVREKFLNKASKNVDRLCGLIQDLNEISRLESGEMPLSRDIFIIQDLIKDVFDSVTIKAELKGIIFSIKKGCEAPVSVAADQGKIRQVLINLVDNSIKYGKQNGHTIASVYKMEDKKVLVEITDDGVGITENHIPRIFERFYRTDRARSRAEGGTGLGLAIVKHIIEAHGQTINVRSKQDVGSTFGFTLDAGKN